MGKHYNHLTFTDRLRIETLKREGYKNSYIALRIKVHPSTITRELKRGTYQRLDGSAWKYHEAYSPDIAHDRYRANLKAKGVSLKIGNDHALAEHIEHKITKQKYSPAAVLGEIKAQELKFNTTICVATLYNYISAGIFLTLRNKHLPIKGKKRPYHKIKRRPARPPKGESIEKRPQKINERREFGHWEMDSVESGQSGKRTLLVLTERKTRKEIIIPVAEQTSACTVTALDELRLKNGTIFHKLFKSITVDNGKEFQDYYGMSRYTKIYYCHPRNPQERGSNENANRLIRRFYPKGTNFDKVNNSEIAEVEDWINNYSRQIFGWHTSNEMFAGELAKLRT